VAPLPAHERLGIAVAGIDEGRVVLTWDPDADHYNPLGIVHGGATATLCDTVMGCAVLSRLPAGVAMTTRELTVRYARPITAGLGQLRCEGWTTLVRGRATTAEARVTDAAGRVHASATATYLILR
jgi:uncharacterized protein (TIGR00369 family)